MKWLFILLIVVAVLFIAWLYGERTIKTVYLIARMSPYEQAGTSNSRILVLGDSTGYGTGAKEASNTIAGRIGTDFPTYKIENNSVNGRTIGELIAVAESIEGEYDLILLQIGGNDILQQRELGSVRTELETVVRSLSDNTRNLVMISSGNVGVASAFTGEKATNYERLTREFKAMFAEIGEVTNLTYVDLFIEPENDPFLQDPDTYLAIDGLHPSDEGYGIWYQTLSPVLKEVLE